jgi:hypothetical protein
MPGVPRELIEHELHLDSKAKPVKQQLCHFAQDKKDVIKREIARLLDVDFIKEVYHPDWLTNPIFVTKKNKDWRMCVDYTDLNKACKKDPFELPQIDQVVDCTADCNLLSFLDCCFGYHQIPLKVEDQIKTSFITPFGAFCYSTMPFRLKSAGTTYQRGIQWCLHSQLERNVEEYIDDVVVKTREDKGLISDLVETFNNLRKFKIKLNSEKCTFGVPSGKLLGYMVSRRGIDPIPEKVSAITKMNPPESLHDVQKLTGCMATLSRFISWLGVKGLLFFKLLKKHDNFQWTQEAQEAFKDLKKYLTTPPTLVATEHHENLQLYISAASNVVSTSIVVERGESDTANKIQYLVYFISKVLSDSKTSNSVSQSGDSHEIYQEQNNDLNDQGNLLYSYWAFCFW